VRAELGTGAQAAQRLGDLLAGAHEHVGELDRPLHRSFDPVQAELGRGLLGVVDDVVERRRERVAFAGRERRAQAPSGGQAVDDVVRDAVAFLLADLQVLSEGRALGVLGEQVAQQKARSLHVATGLLDQGHQIRVHAPRGQPHHSEHIPRRQLPAPFTTISRLDYEFATPWQGGRGRLGRVSSPGESAAGGDAQTLRAGELEVRLADGLVLAGGHVLTLSVREFELLVALARRLGAIVRRDELFRTVWRGELRPGDQSVDVYIIKL